MQLLGHHISKLFVSFVKFQWETFRFAISKAGIAHEIDRPSLQIPFVQSKLDRESLWLSPVHRQECSLEMYELSDKLKRWTVEELWQPEERFCELKSIVAQNCRVSKSQSL